MEDYPRTIQEFEARFSTEEGIFQLHYRRLVTRLGHKRAIWAIAHRLCRLTWLILHQGVDYIEYGAERNAKALQRRTAKQLRELRALGYQILAPASKQQLT